MHLTTKKIALNEKDKGPLNDYTIRTLNLNRSNFEKIINLIDTAWKADYGQMGYLTYSAERLSWTLSSPQHEPSLIVGAFSEDKLIGFNAVIPISIVVGKSQLKCGISTYLSVHPFFRRMGIAKELLSETFNRMQLKNFDLCFAYFDTTLNKQGGKPVYQTLEQDLKFSYRSSWFVCLLDPKLFTKHIGLAVPIKEFLKTEAAISAKLGNSISSKKPLLEKILIKSHGYFDKITKSEIELDSIVELTNELETTGSRDQILSLLNQNYSRNRITRHWTPPELNWYMLGKDTFSILHKDLKGEIDGIINYLIQNIRTKNLVKFAWIDYFNISNLRYNDKRMIINYTLKHAKQQGATAVVLPITGTFSKTPFIRCGFIPYPRNFELYTIPFSDKLGSHKYFRGRHYQVEVR